MKNNDILVLQKESCDFWRKLKQVFKKYKNKHIYIYGLNCSKEKIFSYILCTVSNVNYIDVQTNNLNKSKYHKIFNAMRYLDRKKVFIDCENYKSVESIILSDDYIECIKNKGISIIITD